MIPNNFKKWQNYVHYLMLTAAIFIFIHPASSGLEMQVVNGLPYAWAKLFFFYAFWIFVADTLIHWLFSILPKPYKWGD